VEVNWQSIGAGAISGAATVWLVVRSWIAHADAKFKQTEDHERKIGSLEERQGRTEKDVKETGETLKRVEGTLSVVANDLSYLRGRSDGSSRTTSPRARQR
jgi:hypothetical protein